MKFLAIATLSLLPLLAAVSARAQFDIYPPEDTASRRQANPLEGGADEEKVRTARALIRRQDYQGAADLLETVWAKDQNNQVVYRLLRSCYQNAKLNEKLLYLAQRAVTTDPQGFEYRIDVAQACVSLQRADEALSGFREALKLVNDEKQYYDLIESLVAGQFDKEALGVIDSLVPKVTDPGPLLFQKGIILERRADYPAAARLYLALTSDTSRMGSDAEKRLLDLLKFEQSSEPVQKELLAQNDSMFSARALQLLSAFYLSTDRYDEAFRLAVRQDSLEGTDGRPLYRVMSYCRDRHQYASAVKAGQYIVAHYPNSPILATAYLALGQALAEMGQTNEALTVYDTALTHLPRPRDQAEALCAIGRIHLNLRNDPETALTYFDSVVNRYPQGLGYMASLQLRPHCFLRRGEFDRARQEFSRLLDMHLNEDACEEVEYYLGLIDFCQHRFDSAAVAFKRILVKYPRGFFVNDALALQVVMDRTEQAPGLLAAYADAAAYELRKMIDSTVVRLTAIACDSNTALTDLALWRLVQISLDRADTTSALQYIDQMATKVPDSYYCPYGLKTKADILLASPASHQEALELYRRLLEQFPDYPFASEVRQRLRQITAGA